MSELWAPCLRFRLSGKWRVIHLNNKHKPSLWKKWFWWRHHWLCRYLETSALDHSDISRDPVTEFDFNNISEGQLLHDYYGDQGQHLRWDRFKNLVLPRPSLWSSHHSCGQQRIVGQGSWIPPWSLQTLTPGKRKLDEMMVMKKVLLRKVLPGSRRKCQWQWRQQKVQFPGRGYHPEVLRRHLPRMLSLTMMLWSNFQHFERNIKWRWRQWWDLDAVGKEAEDGAKPEK